MTDFFNRFYKWITIAVVLLLVAVIEILERFSLLEGIKPYFQDLEKGMGIWLPVLVLLWLWKFENDWRHDLQSQLDRQHASLKQKVADNQERISQLWNAFSGQIADTDLDDRIRGILTQYSSVVQLENDDKIGEKVKENIKAADTVLNRRQYSVNFDVMDVYPGPFYQSAKQSIISTNIGGVSKFWGNRSELVKMNQLAVERISSTRQCDQSAVRRVFAIG
ncbi:MAG: hypothetical protein OXG24_10315, partial [Gammaproteobacteria bacterium]|nr:hypothetical protein [Gammaproteobacteria bacterium]